ncbi:MAG TPA: DUF29 domain-containing protein [Stellaceae bacterium]|jgi:hypothetical protein|nr:DUF29 domain-containing protein [Stellaceae bacterium]
MARNSAAYDDDFFAWTQDQARLLREGNLSLVDAENVAEEIESMGRSDRRQLESRFIVLLMHLLKWQVQTEFQSRSWSSTIRTQRHEIEVLLEDSPSLRHVVDQPREALYLRARRNAADETGISERNFPAECPFTPAQILAEDFLPEDQS